MPTQAHKLPQVQNRKKQKKKAPNFAQSHAIRGIFGGEQGIRTLEQVIARYTISNRLTIAFLIGFRERVNQGSTNKEKMAY